MNEKVQSRVDATAARNRIAFEVSDNLDVSKCRSYGVAMLNLANASTRNISSDLAVDDDDVSVATTVLAVADASSKISKSSLVSRLLIEEAMGEADNAARSGVVEFKSSRTYGDERERRKFSSTNLNPRIKKDNAHSLSYWESFDSWIKTNVTKMRQSRLKAQVEEQRRKLQHAIAAEYHNRIRSVG